MGRCYRYTDVRQVAVEPNTAWQIVSDHERMSEWTALFYSANLTGAILDKAVLTRAHVDDANLTGVSLARSDLTGANLEHANLTRAHLGGANLTGVGLSDANLTGADLGAKPDSLIPTGANLTGANLSGANLTDIYYDASTQWPNGFQPPPSRARR
jgi:uncharacterized protein YjbI with pentapeptide repeats